MPVAELRIHGVSGSAPEQVLNNPILRRVAGDTQTGFYRPRVRLEDDQPPEEVYREAYSWGYLTAGAAARALWLLLLPFMLANIAFWMRPARAVGSTRRLHFASFVVKGLCRTICLILTLTLVLAAAGVAMDLAAWQCAGSSCGEGRWFLSFLQGWQPGARIALGSLVPFATLCLLWILGRATWQRYEEREDTPRVNIGKSPKEEVPLTEKDFWQGRHLVSRLRAAHTSAGFAVIAFLVTFPVWRFDAESNSRREVFGVILLVSAMFVGLSSAISVWLPAVVARNDKVPSALWCLWVLRFFAIGLLGSALIYAVLDRPEWRSAGSMPGHSALLTVLFFVQIGLLIILACAVFPLQRAAALRMPSSSLNPVFHGFATPIVSAVSLFVGGAFSAGAMVWTANYLGQAENSLSLPPSLAWAAFAAPLAVLAALAVAATAHSLVLPHLRRRAGTVTDSDYPHRRKDDPEWANKIDRIISTSSLTDQASRFISLLVLPGVAVAVALVTVAVAVNLRPIDLAAPGTDRAQLTQWLTASGSWLISFVVVGLVFLGVQAYRTPRLRRGVGILWDVGTFWPRAAHPLAPPCYAERAVPEIAQRVKYFADQGGVILAGHSQGSVLAVAAVLQLPADTQAKCALLTYGSPLRRLYSRYFPAYLGENTLNKVSLQLSEVDGSSRWCNLWRATDPIGGPVRISGIDERLRDPADWAPAPGDTVHPPVKGHSYYEEEPAYAEAIEELRDTISHSGS